MNAAAKKPATVGTKASIAVNALTAAFGAAQLVDWVNVIPGGQKGAYVALGVALANSALHAFTGNSPVVGKK